MITTQTSILVLAFTLLSMGLIALYTWIAFKGSEIFTQKIPVQELLKVVFTNLALLVMPILFGFYTQVTEGEVYHSLFENLYLVNLYLFGSLMLINLLVSLFMHWLPMFSDFLKWTRNV